MKVMTDQVRRYTDDHSDLEQRMRLSTILNPLSRALAPGSNFPDAKAGDILVNFEDSEQLFPRSPGVPFLPVVFNEVSVEWGPERGSGGAPIAHHDFMPLDATWLEIGGRKMCVRPNGNRIEQTVFLHMLVGGYKATLPFKSTSYQIGKGFAREADKVRVTIDGEVVRVCGAMWLLSSEFVQKGGHSWWAPVIVKKLGALGEEHGPSLELVKQARDMRFEFKAEEETRKATLSAPSPTPALTRSAGSISFTSGVERRSWADPQAPGAVVEPKPEPAKSIDPKLNDGLDKLPLDRVTGSASTQAVG
jgi:hypothetical protein